MKFHHFRARYFQEEEEINKGLHTCMMHHGKILARTGGDGGHPNI